MGGRTTLLLATSHLSAPGCCRWKPLLADSYRGTGRDPDRSGCSCGSADRSYVTPEIQSVTWQYSLPMMADIGFLPSLQQFQKDAINDETIELMNPYLEMENFNRQTAKSASAAAEGLCVWVIAMKMYTAASKIVKPKMEALAISMAELDVANQKLAAAAEKLAACKAQLAALRLRHTSTFPVHLQPP